MHSLRNSISKRLYATRLKSKACARLWSGQYYEERNGFRIVSCKTCPKFDARRVRCGIPFGSPVRKCVSAAQEANLHSLSGMQLLEIGFGKHSIPRRLVTDAGGTWTGIEPFVSTSQKARLGAGGHGQVADIPFPDGTFDVVAGVQTLEHWEEPLPGNDRTPGYAECFAEIHRVLKPGGSIYFDAPIHLHGHEMFVAGDYERIRALLDPALWQDVIIERWREEYAPLERFPTPDVELPGWEQSVKSYSKQQLEDIRENRSVALVTLKAVKK
jgi:SAM-dependent methyltransferase